MKYLMATIALFTSSISLATDYTFKQALFTTTAIFKNADDNSAVPALEFSGHVLWREDDQYNQPFAQITIRRTTYDCDDVNSGYGDAPYTCNIDGAKFLQILDEVATQNQKYAEAVEVFKHYYQGAYTYRQFQLPLGDSDQTGAINQTDNIEDPDNEKLSVDVTTKSSGLNPL